MEKLRQNKKFKYCRVFMIHNFEANYSQNNFLDMSYVLTHSSEKN